MRCEDRVSSLLQNKRRRRNETDRKEKYTNHFPFSVLMRSFSWEYQQILVVVCTSYAVFYLPCFCRWYVKVRVVDIIVCYVLSGEERRVKRDDAITNNREKNNRYKNSRIRENYSSGRNKDVLTRTHEIL